MGYGLSFLAAVAVAVCNALAAVLQKMSADKKYPVVTFNIGIIFALLRDWPYLLGTLLDIIAGGFILLASHALPLFLVQSLIATSIIFTSIFELVIFKRKITSKKLLAMVVVLAGLAMIVIATQPHYASLVGNPFKVTLAASLLIAAVAGLWCLKTKAHLAAFGLAALSGICFGMTSVVGRVLTYPRPLWHIGGNPLAWSILIYAALGLFFFTVALQRLSATAVNSVMVGFQTIIPATIGIVFLGDSAKDGYWPVAIAGSVLALIGCLYTALNHPDKTGANS